MGPFPSQTLERLLDLGESAVFIRGNTEREVLKDRSSGEADPHPWAAIARRVAASLSPSQHEVLRARPDQVIEVDGLGAALFCHGTPRSDEEIVTRNTPDGFMREVLAGVEQPLVVSGHTHVQFDRRVDRVRWVNAGSVGMPYEGRPGAHWALLETDVTLRRTEYDFKNAAAAIASSGFPDGEEFARQYVLEPATATAASAQFEKMAERRRARPQS